MATPDAAVKDIFISYTSTDQAWADWFAWVLEDKGYTAKTRAIEQSLKVGPLLTDRFFSQSSPLTSNDLEASDLTLLLVSKNYIQLFNDQTTGLSLFLERDTVTDAEVKTTIRPGQLGRVRMNGVRWRACCDRPITLAEGTQVRVLGRRANILVVEPLDQNEEIQKIIPVLLENCELPSELRLSRIANVTNLSEVETEETVLEIIKSDENTLDESRIQTASDLYLRNNEILLEADQALKLRRRPATVQGYRERLTADLNLEMMQIPVGRFLMGSPEDEPERNSNEGPQHEVQVPGFFMGKYSVTQVEWRWVAENLPQVNRELKADPSSFKGDRHPVERVSWYDAVEFCDRLSLYTGRTYRLPSEAEWEYACRADTKTPFHFGETITTTVANYNGADNPNIALSGSYGRGPKGEYRRQTTSVDYFKVTNGFGLCDMHGNIWEWCLDHSHSSYEGAPKDGSAWIDEKAEKNRFRIIRGGSWISLPRDCRSAHYDSELPREFNYNLGFRVVCVVSKTGREHLENAASNNKTTGLSSNLLRLLTLACQEGFQDRAIAQQLQISEAEVRALWEESYKVLGIDIEAEKADGRNLRVTCCLRAQQRGLIE
ncbi:MAG: SUMF1/EgtB/PvdO family nonheme iron enzyme [Cyanobacteria bacterium P01_C01_bin.70]